MSSSGLQPFGERFWWGFSFEEQNWSLCSIADWFCFLLCLLQPKLSESLLKKPPFRFLHDIVTEVKKNTGFPAILEEHDMDSGNFKDKDSKVFFQTGLGRALSCSKSPHSTCSKSPHSTSQTFFRCRTSRLLLTFRSHRWRTSTKSSVQ
eukprot:3452039-Rhodomonas_salina.1